MFKWKPGSAAFQLRGGQFSEELRADVRRVRKLRRSSRPRLVFDELKTRAQHEGHKKSKHTKNGPSRAKPAVLYEIVLSTVDEPSPRSDFEFLFVTFVSLPATSATPEKFSETRKLRSCLSATRPRALRLLRIHGGSSRHVRASSCHAHHQAAARGSRLCHLPAQM